MVAFFRRIFTNYACFTVSLAAGGGVPAALHKTILKVELSHVNLSW